MQMPAISKIVVRRATARMFKVEALAECCPEGAIEKGRLAEPLELTAHGVLFIFPPRTPPCYLPGRLGFTFSSPEVRTP